MVTDWAPRTAKVPNSIPRIGVAKATGAVAIRKRAHAVAQSRNARTLLVRFIDVTFTTLLFIGLSTFPLPFDFGKRRLGLFEGDKMARARNHIQLRGPDRLDQVLRFRGGMSVSSAR